MRTDIKSVQNKYKMMCDSEVEHNTFWYLQFIQIKNVFFLIHIGNNKKVIDLL